MTDQDVKKAERRFTFRAKVKTGTVSAKIEPKKIIGKQANLVLPEDYVSPF
jgi:hypothetical protein